MFLSMLRLRSARNDSLARGQAHPLDFVRDKQALLLGNGTRIPIAGVFTDKGA